MPSESKLPIFTEHRADELDDDFTAILLRGPLAAMKTFIPEDKCRNAALRLVQSSLMGIADELNRMMGTQLLEDSRSMARKQEKTWFLITINLDDWLESMGTLELVLRIALTVNAWQFEEIPKLLDMLHDMNPETEYMLSLEIFDSTVAKTFYYAGVIMRPGEAVTTTLPKGYKIDPYFFHNECKQFMNRMCPVCHSVSVKLRKCSVCLVRYYCSPECQSSDWKLHRTLCRRLKCLRQQNELMGLD